MSEVRMKIPLFGKTIEVEIYDSDQARQAYVEPIIQEALRLQSIFNLFDPASELSRLNEGREAIVSEELGEVLRQAIHYGEQTGGVFDVSKGKQMLARKRGEALPPVSCSFRDFDIQGNYVSLTHPDVLIDLGAIAKGFIVDRLIEYMQGLGIKASFVNGRGDMRVFGNQLEVVEVQHPRQSDSRFPPIVIQNQAVATSGDYRQFDGRFEKSHLIGSAEFISVSAVAPTLTQADAIATCVILSGKERGKEFLKQYPFVKVFAVDQQLNQFSFNGYEHQTLVEVSHGLLA